MSEELTMTERDLLGGFKAFGVDKGMAVHDGASKGNRGRAGGGSIQNSRSAVKKKFSMEAPIEEKKNLIALHNLDETNMRG